MPFHSLPKFYHQTTEDRCERTEKEHRNAHLEGLFLRTRKEGREMLTFKWVPSHPMLLPFSDQPGHSREPGLRRGREGPISPELKETQTLRFPQVQGRRLTVSPWSVAPSKPPLPHPSSDTQGPEAKPVRPVSSLLMGDLGEKIRGNLCLPTVDLLVAFHLPSL